jgi:hypothetical protein
MWTLAGSVPPRPAGAPKSANRIVTFDNEPDLFVFLKISISDHVPIFIAYVMPESRPKAEALCNISWSAAFLRREVVTSLPKPNHIFLKDSGVCPPSGILNN